jgi:RNA polymerase sigma-70 factor (ECF subfamily)
MNEAESEIQQLFELAKAGNRDALGRLLDAVRPELCQMAHARIDPELKVRMDPSDIAQQSCLSAVRNFGRFEGSELAEFVGWVRHIHEQNLRDVVRDHRIYEKRAVSKEAAHCGELDAIDQWTASPSHQAMRGERRERIAEILATLPEDQREALRLRHMEGFSLAQIAERLGRTEPAIAGLLKRGLAKLRARLKGEREG